MKKIATATVSQHAPSIEDRLKLAYRKLTILIGLFTASQAESEDEVVVFDDDMKDAILCELEEAREALFWVHRLPGVVLTLPAPADDDIIGYNTIQAGEVGDLLDAHLREQMRRLQQGGAR